MARKIVPFGPFVVLKMVSIDKTKGGLVLPDSAKNSERIGEVLAAGPGRPLEERGNVEGALRRPMSVRPGDIVLIGKYGHDFTIDGEKYTIVSEDEIFGKLE